MPRAWAPRHNTPVPGLEAALGGPHLCQGLGNGLRLAVEQCAVVACCPRHLQHLNPQRHPQPSDDLGRRHHAGPHAVALRERLHRDAAAAAAQQHGVGRGLALRHPLGIDGVAVQDAPHRLGQLIHDGSSVGCLRGVLQRLHNLHNKQYRPQPTVST